MSHTENLKPFFKHSDLLRRWFDLICIVSPRTKQILQARLSNVNLNLELTGDGLIKEIRRNGTGANVLVENTQTRAKGRFFRREEYTLPARLVYRAPHCQIILYAPHKTEQGCTLAGRITVEVYAGTLPHEKTEGLQMTCTYEEVLGKHIARKPQLSVTPTVDAIGTEDVESMLALKDLLDALYAEEGLRLMAKHIFETVLAGYAENDEWSADLKRLATITNQPLPEAQKQEG